MRGGLLHISETQIQIYGVSICVPAVITFFILAYIIIKEWMKKPK
jgi:hypothetical protein